MFFLGLAFLGIFSIFFEKVKIFPNPFICIINTISSFLYQIIEFPGFVLFVIFRQTFCNFSKSEITLTLFYLIFFEKFKVFLIITLTCFFWD
jgi:hypothetical protein